MRDILSLEIHYHGKCNNIIILSDRLKVEGLLIRQVQEGDGFIIRQSDRF